VRVGALGEPGVLERLLAADDAVSEAVVEPAVVFAVDVSLRENPLIWATNRVGKMPASKRSMAPTPLSPCRSRS